RSLRSLRPFGCVQGMLCGFIAYLLKSKHPLGRAGVWLQGRSEEPCGAKDMFTSSHLLQRLNIANSYKKKKKKFRD
ncbi:MAG TPA: hypothetical protein VFG99_07075, partial [Chloroflexia bacterium]|nr:hypothetical protein [Chloroflexia bacterium]